MCSTNTGPECVGNADNMSKFIPVGLPVPGRGSGPGCSQYWTISLCLFAFFNTVRALNSASPLEKDRDLDGVLIMGGTG